MTGYTGEHLDAALAAAGLHDWHRDGETIRTCYLTGDFATGLKLTAQIGQAAEAANHHPDITLTYPHVDVLLTSHDVGAVTDRDLKLAAQISALAQRAGIEAQG